MGLHKEGHGSTKEEARAAGFVNENDGLSRSLTYSDRCSSIALADDPGRIRLSFLVGARQKPLKSNDFLEQRL